jgi:hypothetical protein
MPAAGNGTPLATPAFARRSNQHGPNVLTPAFCTALIIKRQADRLLRIPAKQRRAEPESNPIEGSGMGMKVTLAKVSSGRNLEAEKQ